MSQQRLTTNAPELVGGTHWIGTPHLLASLRGHPTLVLFWTFGCINCVRTVPYVQRWLDRYGTHGFRVVGVHTPEFEHERDPARVEAFMRRSGVYFPTVLDNDLAIWNAYQNQYWPCGYLVDRDGLIVDVFVGEGAWPGREAKIQALLEGR